MIKEIVTHPAEILRATAAPIMDPDWPVYDLVKDLMDTMAENNGVGIAAPQIGISKAVCLVGDKHPLILINPIITYKNRVLESDTEGCLSLPGVFVNVLRPTRITVEALGIHGWNIAYTLFGPIARIAQHEIDHLNGKLIIDYASKSIV